MPSFTVVYHTARWGTHNGSSDMHQISFLAQEAIPYRPHRWERGAWVKASYLTHVSLFNVLFIGT